jgi:hypothetical protein
MSKRILVHGFLICVAVIVTQLICFSSASEVISLNKAIGGVLVSGLCTACTALVSWTVLFNERMRNHTALIVFAALFMISLVILLATGYAAISSTYFF